MSRKLTLALLTLTCTVCLSSEARKFIKDEMVNAPVQEVSKDNYQSVITKSNYVILDIYANWCGPCRNLAPIFQSLNQDLGHLYSFVKLNGPENEEILESLHVRAYPTIIFFKEGKEIGRHVGFMNKEKFRDTIQKEFNNTL